MNPLTKTRRSPMQKRIHMMDQVGTNKVEEIMTHFDRCTLRMWSVKFMVVGVFLLLGVSWKV